MARILVVDDALFTRKTLSNILEEEGYEIVGQADNAKDAIEVYGKVKPDLVTMDIIMPKMEEIDAITAVQEIMKEDPHAKIVMISAMSQHSLVVKAIQAGAKGFITKPFHASQVIEMVETVLRE
ncbi:MAG: response regulator [Candidatus Omnitrophota bacterium]